MAQGVGGTIMTIPSGVLNAILTNLGAYSIKLLIPYIRFHSTHKRIIATVISIYIISFIN